MANGVSRVSSKSRFSFGWQVLVALLAGLLLGLWARAIGDDADGSLNWLAQTLDVIGDTFVQLLRAVVPPLVFTAIVASIARLRQLSNAASLVWNTLLWFAITAAIAVSIGIALGLIMQPGLHASVSATAAELPETTGSWLDFLRNLVPSNSLALQAENEDEDEVLSTTLDFNVLQIVVLAIVVGAAAVKVGEKAEPFLVFNQSLHEIVRRILRWIIQLTPIGTVGLLGNAVGQYGWQTLASLAVFASALYLGLALVMFVVYPSLLAMHGLSPLRFFQHVWPATTLAFVSRSSVGTMPLTQAVAEMRLGVPSAYAAFAVPLGATTKMDGCAAIYPALSAIFVAGFYGITLQATDYLLIVMVSVLGSAATAGVTGAVVMMTLTLSTLGLPLEGAGLLLAIDPILDMGRTAVNVTGQALVPAIVAQRQGMLDHTIYTAEQTAPL